MYNVLTAIKNNMLLQELKRLHIWGASTGFEICEVTSDFATLTEHLRKNRYQLVLLEATPDYPVLNLLQTIRQEKLCQANRRWSGRRRNLRSCEKVFCSVSMTI